MTREEADFIGAMNMCDEISNEAYKKIMCHCEEQEPCEDAVSRKAIVEMLNARGQGSVMTFDHFIELLYKLPTVTPTIAPIDKFNDSVNRCTVLNLINDVQRADGFNDYSQYEYLFDNVDKMPSVTPTQNWIPCSERLPKENVKVLTQDNEGNIQVDWLLHLELRWFYSQHHIVAWQPLPKPYVPDTNVGKMEEIGI